jgi:hypothetical protein
MATLQIENITTEDIYLRDFYTNLLAGKSITVDRAASDLPRLASLQKAVADGQVSLSVSYSADEAASGLHAPPAVTEAGDLAPVAPGTPAAALFTIFKDIPAGAGGAPDDVEIYPAGGLPSTFRVLDVLAFVSTPVGGSSVTLRDEAAGAGSALAAAVPTASAGRKTADSTSTSVATPASAKGLFARRSDSGIALQLVIIARPEL